MAELLIKLEAAADETNLNAKGARGEGLGVGYKNATSADIPIIATVGGAAATGRIDVTVLKLAGN